MDSDRHGHVVALSGPARAAGPGAPALFAFDEADFLRALEERLLAESWPKRGWPASLAARALGAAGAAVRLYQPIHRRFNLAVLDARCVAFGGPRLDPRRIAGSGLVLRRFVGPEQPDEADLAQPRHWQGWMGAESDAQGWTGFTSAGALDADPEATQGTTARTGSAAVDALLAARNRSVKPVERTVPLWVAKPEIAQATGRTLLFGLIPTASPAQQRSQASDVRAELALLRRPGSAERQKFIDHLSPWLKRTSVLAPPRAGGTFDRSWLTQTRIPDDEDVFIAFIEQLAYEFEALGRNAARWRTRLEALRMWRFNPARLGVWKYDAIDPVAFLTACARIVRNDLGTAAAVTMPHLIGPAPEPFDTRPPPPASELIEAITDEALASVEAIAVEQPLPRGPYEDENARYAVRAFVRVKPDDPRCLPRLYWSAPSRLFTIAPWYESTGNPPPPIALPKLDRASLARMKPSTSFLLPPELRGLMNPNGAQATLAGNPRRDHFGIDWVLQLSMPVMTVCGMAAMTVVLTLLDFVFRWIPFASILVPRIRR
jgi:hypothetical protein